MTTFSAIDIALSGFRFARAHPRTVAIWGGVQLLVGLIGVAILISTIGPDMAAMEAMKAGPRAPDAQMMAMLPRMLGFYAAAIPLGLVYFGVLAGAVNRAVATPSDDRLGYLRLGGDEFRQVLLMLLSVLVLIGAELAVAIPVGVVAFASAGFARPLIALAITVFVLLIFAGIVLVMVRLSLASPQTYDTRRVTLFGSWQLTRGHFWKLLGTYLTAFILAMVVSVLISIIAFAVFALLGGGTDVNVFTNPAMSSLGAYFTPARIAATVINGLGGGLTLPVLMMPQVEIYRRLRDGAAA